MLRTGLAWEYAGHFGKINMFPKFPMANPTLGQSTWKIVYMVQLSGLLLENSAT